MATMDSHFTKSLILAVVLVLVLAELTVCAEGAHHNVVKRQVRTCPAGVPCQKILQCQPMLDLLRTGTQQAFAKIRENICAVGGGTFSVCCDEDGGGGGGEDLLPENCSGFSATRILGGEEVTIGSMPFIAALVYSERGNLIYACGGALINQQYVLTAAHCVDGVTIRRPSQIVLGEHDTRTSPDCQTLNNGQNFCAEKEQIFTSFSSIIIHENYNINDASNDIALIRLDRPAVKSTYVSPICLIPPNQDAGAFLRGRRATAAGWGHTLNSRGSESPVLLSVDLPYVERSACASFFSNPRDLKSGQICFGGVRNEDTCSRDSGGPLFASSSTGPPFFLLGVTSRGIRTGGACGEEGIPALYSNVAFYRNWIVSKLRP